MPPNPVLTAKIREALALHNQGNIEAAAGLYGEILKADPAHFDALHLLGVTNLQRGNLEAAVSLIGQAIQVDRKKSPAHSNLGLALRALERHDEALASYTRATALD